LDTQEAENSDTKTESTVETNSAGSYVDDSEVKTNEQGDIISKPNLSSPSKHSIVKGETIKKNPIENIGNVLGNLAKTAASGLTGGKYILGIMSSLY
jgi:hypothetical protein